MFFSLCTLLTSWALLLDSASYTLARTFYQNQHYPLSTYPNAPTGPIPLALPSTQQQILDYSNLQKQLPVSLPKQASFRPAYTFPPAYPVTPPVNKGSTNKMSKEELEELQRQIQQWEIAIVNQANSQPGYVWINAPQYGYYPPPPGVTNYPGYPQPYPGPQYPPPYPGPGVPPDGSSSSQVGPFVTESAEPVEYVNASSSSSSSGFLETSSSSTAGPPITLEWSPPSPTTTTTRQPPTTFWPSPTTTTTRQPPTTFWPSPTTTTTRQPPTTFWPSPTTTTTRQPPTTFWPSSASSSTTTTTEPPITIEWSPSSTTSTTEIPPFPSSSEISSIPDTSTFTYPTTPPETSESFTSSSTSFSTSTTNVSTSSTGAQETTSASSISQNTTSVPSANGTTENPLLKYCKKPRGQFPSETSCNKFINCWDDYAAEQSCPASLVFNPEKQYCDYPQNVNCGNQTSTGDDNNNSTSSSSSNSTETSKCPSAYGTYRNTSNCAAFYVCVAGEPVNFDCPPGTYYNDELKVCDYPYRVNCSGIPVIPSTESTVTNSTEVTESSTSTEVSSTDITSTNSTETSSSSSETPFSSSETAPSSSETSVSSSEVPATSSETPYGSSEILPITTETYPAGTDPIALYNYNLKRIPESIVNTGVRCYHTNIFRLTPDCSSVTLCQDGHTYIVNCGHGTSFDAYSQKCVASYRARC